MQMSSLIDLHRQLQTVDYFYCKVTVPSIDQLLLGAFDIRG